MMVTKTKTDRYFIAIIPPSPVFEQAHTLKLYFQETYNSKAALRSPPHITLHMPFMWKTAKEDELINELHLMAATLSPLQIILKGFGCFKPRVIFIQTELSDDLASLQKQISKFCKKELGLFNADAHDQPFHPHLTIAFRDLRRPAFESAWKEFEKKEFKGNFIASSMWLLRLDGQDWQPFRELPLARYEG